MSKHCVVQASLVDIRNLNTNKSLKMTLEVPAEQAQIVLQAFGWPTQVDPVPVAIARLDQRREQQGAPQKPREARPWDTLPSVQQAAIRCNDAAFRRFLRERWPKFGSTPLTPEEAADLVRSFCWVQSRKEIEPGSEAEKRWRDLDRQFLAWQNGCVATTAGLHHA